MAAPAGTPPPAASMSLATLCDVLAATVSPVAETRKAAEATLTQARLASADASTLAAAVAPLTAPPRRDHRSTSS